MEDYAIDRSLILRLSDAGRPFYAGTKPFHTDAPHGSSAPTRMGNVLRIFSQGLQVCLEIVVTAADGGLLRCDQPCVAIAGTARGADTALTATPASSGKLEEMRVDEILCKPHLMGEA